MLHSPVFLDNVETIQVFDDDKHIKNFMTSQRVFMSQQIEEEEEQSKDEDHL